MIYFWIAAVSIMADQLTKYLVAANNSLYDSTEIIPGFFNLVYVTNKGAAFSMFADMQSPLRHYFFLGAAFLACLGLTIINVRLDGRQRVYRAALGLIAGGAAGNLIDRLRHGAVIDFLDFYWGSYHWPAFNVADSCICVGAVLLLILNFMAEEKKEV